MKKQPYQMKEEVIALAKQGLAIKKIVRTLKISRNTIRRMLREQDKSVRQVRSDKILIPEDVLMDTYHRCEGWIERTHEELIALGYRIGYSTLTRLLRQVFSPEHQAKIAQSYPDVPGEEFQHDTTPISVKIAGHHQTLVLSTLYYRFSKIVYGRFYPFFRRFEMQCFLHEAMMSVGYACKYLIIDNTNLAVLRGTGPDAVMVPEMIAFAQSYDFIYQAHDLGHSDRKGGVEKGHHTVMSNFLPGRSFTSLEDLNQQLRTWGEKRRRKKLKGGVPSTLLALEIPSLRVLPPTISPPYQLMTRKSDQYGFISFKANFFWIGRAHQTVDVLVYADELTIYHGRKKLAHYRLPAYGVRQQKITPEGIQLTHLYPNNGRTSRRIESKLRDLGGIVPTYLEKSFGQFRTQRSRQAFIRRLESVAQRVEQDVFLAALTIAHDQNIYDANGVEKLVMIALQRQHQVPKPPPEPTIGNYQERDSYQQLKTSTIPDLTIYQQRHRKEPT